MRVRQLWYSQVTKSFFAALDTIYVQELAINESTTQCETMSRIDSSEFCRAADKAPQKVWLFDLSSDHSDHSVIWVRVPVRVLRINLSNHEAFFEKYLFDFSSGVFETTHSVPH